MDINQILATTAHRPWPIPERYWMYYQEWNNAVFLHYKVDIDLLKQFVPQELKIDLFQGDPWVSIVVFTMENIRPRFLPSFSPISFFHEINIRTYVTRNGKSGVYFLSIEGSKLLSCQVAKTLSELPYRFSEIHRGNKIVQSKNVVLKDFLSLKYSTGEAVGIKDPIDIWLTERYALFQECGKFINEFEIHHLEWPLNLIELEELKYSYSKYNSLLKGSPDKIHYSKGVKVLAWGKKKTLRNNFLGLGS